MNIAIILAGGAGNRMESDFPKQFYKVAGKTVIEHTIHAFQSHTSIDEIAIVIHEHFVEQIENLILRNQWTKVKKVLLGGKERFQSSLAAINAYQEFLDANIIFHDAVRPLVSQKIIDDTIAALRTYNAVDVAIPAVDTIIQTDESGQFIREIPIRKYLRRGQTPQGFKLQTIKNAYNIALKDPNFISSDDCGVVVKYLPDEKVYVVAGDEANMKLTYKEDSYLIDKLFQLKSQEMKGVIDYSQLKNKTVVIFGGASGIGKGIAELCEQNGANVFCFSRRLTNTDISSRTSVSTAFKDVYSQMGGIDFVVNTAAVLHKEPLVNMDEAVIAQQISTNYIGAVNVALESFQYLKLRKGQLLFYTSSSYTRGRAFYSLYSSTKAAIVNLTQALSQEWEPFGVRVNCMNPERTHTLMRVQNFGNESRESLLTIDQVAKASLLTLLSDHTGQIIDVKMPEE